MNPIDACCVIILPKILLMRSASVANLSGSMLLSLSSWGVKCRRTTRVPYDVADETPCG